MVTGKRSNIRAQNLSDWDYYIDQDDEYLTGTLARRADRARGEARRRLVDRLARKLSKLDPFEGFSENTIWFAKLVARVKWVDSERLD